MKRPHNSSKTRTIEKGLDKRKCQGRRKSNEGKRHECNLPGGVAPTGCDISASTKRGNEGTRKHASWAKHLIKTNDFRSSWGASYYPKKSEDVMEKRKTVKKKTQTSN